MLINISTLCYTHTDSSPKIESENVARASTAESKMGDISVLSELSRTVVHIKINSSLMHAVDLKMAPITHLFLKIINAL